MVHTIKVGLIGYGYLGRWHADKVELCEESELIGVCDLSSENREKAKEKFPDKIITDSYEELLSKCDAIIIVTPTSSHYSLLKLAIAEGKHIFCEKPLCSTYSEASEILNSVEKMDKVFMVGHSERCHEVWETTNFKQFKKATFTRKTPFKGRAGDVDVIQDLTIHDIDLVAYLFQSPFKKIRTNLLENSITEHIDRVDIDAVLESGVEVKFITDRDASEEERAVTFDEKYSVNLMEFSYNLPEQIASYKKRDHLLVEQLSFYHSIYSGEKPLTTFAEGAKALKIIDLIFKSNEQKDWVEL